MKAYILTDNPNCNEVIYLNKEDAITEYEKRIKDFITNEGATVYFSEDLDENDTNIEGDFSMYCELNFPYRPSEEEELQFCTESIHLRAANVI